MLVVTLKWRARPVVEQLGREPADRERALRASNSAPREYAVLLDLLARRLEAERDERARKRWAA